MKKLILMVFLLGSCFVGNTQIEIVLDVKHEVYTCFINEVNSNEYRPLNEKEFIVEGSQITMYVEEYHSYEIVFFTKNGKVDCILLRPMDFDIRDVRDLEINTSTGDIDVKFIKGVLVFDY